jgi:hypothetical protein
MPATSDRADGDATECALDHASVGRFAPEEAVHDDAALQVDAELEVRLGRKEPALGLDGDDEPLDGQEGDAGRQRHRLAPHHHARAGDRVRGARGVHDERAPGLLGQRGETIRAVHGRRRGEEVQDALHHVQRGRDAALAHLVGGEQRGRDVGRRAARARGERQADDKPESLRHDSQAMRFVDVAKPSCRERTNRSRSGRRL